MTKGLVETYKDGDRRTLVKDYPRGEVRVGDTLYNFKRAVRVKVTEQFNLGLGWRVVVIHTGPGDIVDAEPDPISWWQRITAWFWS